jgi:hypothetical protein
LKKKLDENKFVKEREGPERRRLDEIEHDLAITSNEYERTSIKCKKL